MQIFHKQKAEQDHIILAYFYHGNDKLGKIEPRLHLQGGGTSS